jgi:hypothetical protein
MRPFLLLVLLAGCASFDPQAEKRAWLGASYDEVVARWGQPASGERLPDGVEVRTWITEMAPLGGGTSLSIGGVTFGRGVGIGTGVSIPIGEPPAPIRCERVLYFRDAQVIDQEWTGADEACRAVPPRTS